MAENNGIREALTCRLVDEFEPADAARLIGRMDPRVGPVIRERVAARRAAELPARFSQSWAAAERQRVTSQTAEEWLGEYWVYSLPDLAAFTQQRGRK